MSLSFLRFPVNLRQNVADYLFFYPTATEDDKAKYELITFLAEERWNDINKLFREKIKEIKIDVDSCILNCKTALKCTLQKNKEPKVYIGHDLRLFPTESFTPSYPDAVLQLQAHFFKSKKNIPIEETLKLIKLLTKKELNGTKPENVQVVATRIFNYGNTLFSNQTQNRKIATNHVILHQKICSVCQRLYMFIEGGLRFVEDSERYQMILNKSTLVSSNHHGAILSVLGAPHEAFEKIAKSEDVEERSFWYRWIKFVSHNPKFKIDEPALISKLKEDELEDFKRKYAYHRSPLIRSIAAFCIHYCQLTTTLRDFRNSGWNFLSAFTALYVNQDLFKDWASKNHMNLPEFEEVFNKVVDIFSFLKLPTIVDKEHPINRDCFQAALDEPLNKTSLNLFKSQLLLLKPYSKSIEFIYRLTYQSLVFFDKTQNGKKAIVTDSFEDYFSTFAPKNKHLPKLFLIKPDELFKCCQKRSVVQVGLKPEPSALFESKVDFKEIERDFDEKQLSQKAPQKELSLLDLPREFPFHFNYDKRVLDRFKQLEGDWSKANWEVQSHAFPSDIDFFVGTIYSLQTTWKNTRTGHDDHQHILFADVMIEGQKQFSVTIEYTKGRDCRWYHRYMNKHENPIWDEVVGAEREKSASELKGGSYRLPGKQGQMSYEPLSGSVLIDFKTFKIRLHPLRSNIRSDR